MRHAVPAEESNEQHVVRGDSILRAAGHIAPPVRETSSTDENRRMWGHISPLKHPGAPEAGKTDTMRLSAKFPHKAHIPENAIQRCLLLVPEVRCNPGNDGITVKVVVRIEDADKFPLWPFLCPC